MTEIKKISSERKLALITEQRSALEKVVKISLAITRLQTGLESLLALGKDESKLPKKQIKMFETISKSIQHLPTDKLKQSITFLDSYINTALFGVMQLVAQGEKWLADSDAISAADMDNIHKDIHNNLNAFRQKSQTAVVVRLLLHKRGFHTATFKLPIPAAVITDKISELQNKERSCRQRIGKEIDIMETYIDNLLDTKGLAELIRQEMIEVKLSLQTNRQHLLSGKSLEDLPIIFEIIEMSEEGSCYDLGSNELHEKETPLNEPEIKPEPTPIPRGFYNRLKFWLTSPISVRWKDINK